MGVAQVMILSQDKMNRVALSTRKLERTRGDMLRDPQMVMRILMSTKRGSPFSVLEQLIIAVPVDNCCAIELL